jgi:light-regulated signal transduction histidine kinase (bacteriophytochrome)
VQATKGPLRDEQGSIVGVFGISRDVTENRRVEDEIRLLNAELDLRVRERTARLEAAIQEQESFCYSVSHDLRAPLRHINSYSAILQEECAECLSPEVHGYLERIRISSRNMGKLIDDLLELSRVGRSPLQMTEVNLSELTGEIAFRLQRSEPERRAVFSILPELTARGDRTLLELVLVNLLENAWKYTRREEATRIEVGSVEKNGRQAFFVRDNGVGFDMAYRDKLFGAFQRLHGAEFEGTGIGLAMVKRIVKRHGGKVWAEGALGEGATFYFTLG